VGKTLKSSDLRTELEVLEEGAFPDRDLNKRATRGDILLLAQQLQRLEASLLDIKSLLAPPQNDFDTGWFTVEAQTGERLDASFPLADVEGFVRIYRGEENPLPYEHPEGGKVYIRSITDDGAVTVVNTTALTAGVRLVGRYIEGT
jgi:hypothetical protein